MATRSSILAWKIPWTEEPGGLQSIGSQGVGQNSTHPWYSFQGVAAGFLYYSLLLSVPLGHPLPCKEKATPSVWLQICLISLLLSAVSFPLLPPVCAISKLSLPTLPTVSLEALASFPVGPPCTDHLPLNLASFPNPSQGFPGSPLYPQGRLGCPLCSPPCYLLPPTCSISGLDNIFRCLFSN